MTPITPTMDSSTLRRSSGPGSGLRDSGRVSAATIRTTTITGTLIRKTEPHQKLSRSSPPSSGPAAAPAVVTELHSPIAVVRSRGSVNRLRMIDRVDGMMVAPATPSTARATMSSSAVGA
ncbi:hypothetical protein GCM10020219_079760 [Nonomuraea dietziae]